MRRQIIILVGIILCAPAVFGQILRPPAACSESDLLYCEIFSLDPCPCSGQEVRRVAPIDDNVDYKLPRRIGVVALADDGGYNGLWRNLSGYPNWVAAEEVTGYGISAIHLWPMVSLTDEPGWWPDDSYRDMRWAIRNKGLDLIVIRPMQNSFSELACDGARAAVWEGGDWGEYAEQLYATYYYRAATIILTNWEGDWQLWGARCREPNECPTGDVWPSRQHEEYVACDGDYDCQVAVCDDVRWNRALYLARLFEERQAAIQEVREAHPDSPLTVLFGITVNHTEDTQQLNLSRDVIPFLHNQPDVIALSHWDRDQTMTEALDYIKDNTHHARYNMILIETGAKDGPDQEEKIFNVIDEAMTWGVQAAFVWTWRDTGGGENLGIIGEDNVPRGGLAAVQRLIRKYER